MGQWGTPVVQDVSDTIRESDGVVSLPYAQGTPASVANGMMWMESDGLHIQRDNGEKIVNDAPPA